MQHVIRTLAVLSVVAALGASLFAAKPKPSTPATEVKGEWRDCNTVTESRRDGDNQLITVTIAEKLTGSLNGSYEGIERNVVHKGGSGSFSGSGTFSGEINGRSGTAVMTYSGTVDAKGTGVAHWILDQGSDNLAKVDGHGTFEGKQVKPAPLDCADSNSQSAWSGTYTGGVEFGGAKR